MNKSRFFAAAAAFGLVLMAGAGSAFAGLSEPFRVTIPFDFVVGQTTLPAGEYVISNPNHSSGNLIAIRSANGKPAVFVQAAPSSPKGSLWVKQTKLDFDEVGGKQHLICIWRFGSDVGYSIPRSNLEPNMAQTRRAAGH